ncbi:helix-turn-helix domain-containing protein [Marinobacter arenosus]|uniref:helix-turn-helix domain-containing protein n=1 Tax=Marinobacter arenosus TaxID=2856822 RepID=UPI001C4D984D|nr:helix-turn-helix domain-containing protein [Marinobacter arenosus]
MSDYKDFAQRIKIACDNQPRLPANKEGQETWLSSRLGISHEAVRRWFSGESMPRRRLMADLASLLKVDERWLASGYSGQTFVQDKSKRA